MCVTSVVDKDISHRIRILQSVLLPVDLKIFFQKKDLYFDFPGNIIYI